MTPAARVQAAIDIIGALHTSNQAGDKYLRDYWAARRFAGSKDRAAVSERVYAVLRRRGSFAWRMQGETARALVIASVLAEGADIVPLFDGSSYGPARLSEEETAAIAATPEEP